MARRNRGTARRRDGSDLRIGLGDQAPGKTPSRGHRGSVAAWSAMNQDAVRRHIRNPELANSRPCVQLKLGAAIELQA